MPGKIKKQFLASIGRDNPVFVQVLGICSTLAVTNVLENTVVMCLGLIFATACSSFTVSLLRRQIPGSIRMMVETLIIAAYVIIVDLVIQATLPTISRQLGPYVGLIITNCIVMGRAEAYALNNPPLPSLIDGVAAGVGYSYILMIIAFFRELTGSATIWGHAVPGFSSWWVNWSIMVMAPGAFFALAGLIWIIKTYIVTDETGGK
ncbi:MAG TPA: NADH:ubiquinone reductase (Na(+)-transporting) subunit D [Verrucomicrobia bacterium]|nr:NADH:ubiquinone reductase (Na(+)-transporting) subunit D [Verrucomicrobiota bacterium]